MKVAIGLGSNIDAEANMKKAAAYLREAWPDIVFSSVYESAPRDKEDQPAFFNAVSVMESNLPAETIRQALNLIEQALGKKIEERFGPRTIDLDLLLYDDDSIQTESLTVPHPRMHERRFVLEPLSEVVEESLMIPGQEDSLEVLLASVQEQECEKTNIQL